MRVVVEIAGRRAIPVRALPFLSQWRKWTPDVLVSVFAGTASAAHAIYGRLFTFRVVEGELRPVEQDWWESFTTSQLAALEERLRLSVRETELGYDEWRVEAIRLLPEAVYVWQDEFSEFHARNWRLTARICGQYGRRFPASIDQVDLLGLDAPDDKRAHESTSNDGKIGSPDMLDMVSGQLAELPAIRDLDFSPLIPHPFRQLVEEGLEEAVAPPAEADVTRDEPRGWPRPPIHPIPNEVRTRITEALRNGQSVNSLAKVTGYSRPTITSMRPRDFGRGLGKRKLR